MQIAKILINVAQVLCLSQYFGVLLVLFNGQLEVSKGLNQDIPPKSGAGDDKIVNIHRDFLTIVLDSSIC